MSNQQGKRKAFSKNKPVPVRFKVAKTDGEFLFTFKRILNSELVRERIEFYNKTEEEQKGLVHDFRVRILSTQLLEVPCEIIDGEAVPFEDFDTSRPVSEVAAEYFDDLGMADIMIEALEKYWEEVLPEKYFRLVANSGVSAGGDGSGGEQEASSVPAVS